MNSIKEIISDIRKRKKVIEKKHKSRLIQLDKRLSKLSDFADTLHQLWIGGWGRNDYDYYISPVNRNKEVSLNEAYLINLIDKNEGLNLNSIDTELSETVDEFRSFQQFVATELSIIQGDDRFVNEQPILEKIETYKWGVDKSYYVKSQRPAQIPVFDLNNLSQGLQTPPHINVIGQIVSLNTRGISCVKFLDLVDRILRQVELRQGVNSDKGKQAGSTEILSSIFKNFHDFCNQLKYRHDSRNTIEVKDEYDVQDLLHAILKLHFNDVREEEYTPSFGGGSTRMDFLLKDQNIVIEVKKTREGLNDKKVAQQLILDVAHYSNHANCDHLICFIYDPENRIKNKRGLEADIKKLSSDSLLVEAIVNP